MFTLKFFPLPYPISSILPVPASQISFTKALHWDTLLQNFYVLNIEILQQSVQVQNFIRLNYTVNAKLANVVLDQIACLYVSKTFENWIVIVI